MRHGSEQKWFIGVAAREGLAREVVDFRDWMGRSFGCRSGFRTAPHITLVPPFAPKSPTSPGRTGPSWPDRAALEMALAASLEYFARARDPFTARLSGFDAFGERTLFIAVEKDSLWHMLHSSLYQHLADTIPGLIRPEKTPYVPHLTIANRDIPIGAMDEALSHFRTTIPPFTDDFPVDHLALFSLEGGTWRETGRWGFRG